MSDVLLLSRDALTVPSSKGKPHVFDMRRIHKAEGRLIELANVTRLKAGELLYAVIDAFGEARNHLAVLRMEFGASKQKLRTIRGIIVLDRVQEVLKVKGLANTRSPAGSEDLRDGVVNTDPDYLEAADNLSQVEAAMEHMEGKVKKLEMAYFAINSLTKNQDAKKDTSGGVGDDNPGAFTQQEKVERFVNSVSTVKQEDYDGDFGPPKL
jgi:hypothetical protein